MSDSGASPGPIRTGTGLVAAGREVVWVRGPDTVRFLDGLVSRSVEAMSPGTAARALLLSPRGRLRAALWLLAGEEEVGIVVDAGGGEIVAGDLARFRLRVDAVIEPEAQPTLDLCGPGAAAVVRHVTGAAIPEPAGWAALAGGGLVARTPFLRVSVPRFLAVGVAPETLVAAGAEPVAVEAFEAFRIEAGEPGWAETAGEPIPQETGLVEAAVDSDKGCYLGQELVARIDTRGHVNRHLMGLVMGAGASLPGGPVRCDGREVGEVTSAAHSSRLGVPVALAMVRAEVEAGTTVEVATLGGPAQGHVRELPLDPSL